MAYGDNSACTCMRAWHGVVPPPPCPAHAPVYWTCCTCHCHQHHHYNWYAQTSNTITISPSSLTWIINYSTGPDEDGVLARAD